MELNKIDLVKLARDITDEMVYRHPQVCDRCEYDLVDEYEIVKEVVEIVFTKLNQNDYSILENNK